MLCDEISGLEVDLKQAKKNKENLLMTKADDPNSLIQNHERSLRGSDARAQEIRNAMQMLKDNITEYKEAIRKGEAAKKNNQEAAQVLEERQAQIDKEISALKESNKKGFNRDELNRLVLQESNCKDNIERLRVDYEELRRKSGGDPDWRYKISLKPIPMDTAVTLDGKNIYGRVVDLFDILSEKYTTALSLTAGNKMLNIVTHDMKTNEMILGLKLLQRFEQLIPATEVQCHSALSPGEWEPLVGMAKAKGKHAVPALETIRFDKKHTRVMNYIWGGFLICDDLEMASEICLSDINQKRKFPCSCVTLDGDIVNSTGMLNGGWINPNDGRLSIVSGHKQYKNRAKIQENARKELDIASKKLAVERQLEQDFEVNFPFPLTATRILPIKLAKNSAPAPT
jgi:chromosome segregation ATPase